MDLTFHTQEYTKYLKKQTRKSKVEIHVNVAWLGYSV